MANEEQLFMQILHSYGPLGVFIVSALGNAIPYSTIPYLLFIVIYAGSLDNVLDQVYISVLGGFGAAIGKIVVYYFGKGLRLVMTKEQKHNMEVFIGLFKRSTFLAVFLFAALPLPDDILYIPLGATGYSLLRFFIALLLGKIIITGTAVFFGSTYSWLLEDAADTPWYITYPSLIVVTLILTYMVAKMDWVRIAKGFKEGGLVKGTIILLKETYKAVVSLITIPYRAVRKSR